MWSKATLHNVAKTLSILLPLCVAAIGCGDEPSGPGTGKVYESVPQAEAERTLAHEMCVMIVEGCDCTESVFSSLEHCSEAMSDYLEQDFASAQAAGLVYDAECMANIVNLYTAGIGCATPSELLDLELLQELQVPTCKVHAGTAQQGEACTNYPAVFGDDCAQGLMCQGTCQVVPELTFVGLGQACDYESQICELGLVCEQGECALLPGPGEACTGLGCRDGAECMGSGLDRQCVALPLIGEPCGGTDHPRECAEGAYCNDEQCQPLLSEGERCNGDDSCGPGLVCDYPDGAIDSECMVEEPFVCF